jgi:hypothetical protein
VAALQVDIAGLHAAAASLRAAAQALADVSITPMAHPPLATDETSTSAAARLSEHGAVVMSRAADAAAVLNSAADAIVKAGQSYTAMNTANAALVSLQGSPSTEVASPTAAVTADRTAAHVPIAPPVTRPAEMTAAIMEAGQASAGAPFVSGCTALGEAFGQGGRSARNAAGVVSQHLQGSAGPTISAALDRYADWSDSMTRYTHTLGQMAGDHKNRFSQAQQDTPSTTDFANRHRELQNAIAVYNSRPTPGAAQAVSKAHHNVDALNNRTHIVATTYRTGEDPATPPGPPPVVPIVEPGAGQGDTPPSHAQDGSQPDKQSGKTKAPVGSDDDGDDVIPSDGSDDLGAGLDPVGSPAGAGGMPGMAGSMPEMMTGLLGGMVGMAASIPEKLGQEAQQLAQQATQAVSGLTSGLAGKDKLDDDTHPGELADSFGGGGGGGGDDGGGATAPASDGGTGDLKPAASAMGSVEPSPPPLAGLSGSAPSAPPAAAAGAGGAPMFMPPMGGMGAGAGGGATREVKDPSKTIVPPTRPNSEAVKGERRDPIRHTATVDSAGPQTGEPAKRAVTVRSRTRRIEKPDNGDNGGGK